MNEIILSEQDVQELFGSNTDYMTKREIEDKLSLFYFKMTHDNWLCGYQEKTKEYKLFIGN